MNWIELDDITLHYELSGDGAETLVFLHELGGSLDSFEGLMAALRPNFRILRYDLRGAGRSEKPRSPFSFAAHVTDLRQLVTALRLNSPMHLVGVAAGAALAAAYTLAHPTDVSSLALCAPALTVSRDRVRYLEERSALAVQVGMKAITDMTLDQSYPTALRANGPQYATYRSRFLSNDPVGYAHANMAFAGVDLQDRLGELRKPCMVLAGSIDRLRPPTAVAELAGRIAGAQYAVIDSGHLMSVQAPGEMSLRLKAFIGTISNTAAMQPLSIQ